MDVMASHSASIYPTIHSSNQPLAQFSICLNSLHSHLSMSLLSDFLRTLKDEEINSLKKISFTDREHEAFAKTVQFVGQKNFADAALQAELKMTKAFFDKMNSVLLDKVYLHYAGGEDSKVLYLLWEKGLYDHLFHEARVRERRYIKEGDEKKLSVFYRLVFGVCLRLPITEQKIKLADTYAEKYLSVLKKPPLEEVYEIKIMQFWNTIFYNSAHGNMKEHEPVVLAGLKDWDKKLKNKNFTTCQFFYWLAWSTYYEFYTHDFASWSTALRNALREFDSCKKDLGENYRIFVVTKLAGAYCQGSYFKESLQMYRDAFAKYEKQLLRNLFHPLMFSIIAIINNELEEAEEMLNKHLTPRLYKFPEESLNFDIERTCSLLHMHKGDMEKASMYLQRGQRWDKTQFSLLGDILQRMVHNIYYLMAHDTEAATAMLRKNKKFLSAKKQDQMVEEYGKVFVVIGDIIRHQNGKKLPQDFQQRLDALQNGIMKLYGDLLVRAVKK